MKGLVNMHIYGNNAEWFIIMFVIKHPVNIHIKSCVKRPLLWGC